MRRFSFVATAALATLVTVAPLASAQGRHRGNDGGATTQRRPPRGDAGGGNGGGSNGGGERQRAERQAQPRDGGRVETPRTETPRTETPRRETPRAETQDAGRRDAGRESGRRDLVPQERREPQAAAQGNAGSRSADGRTDGSYGVQRYAVPRTGPVPRYRNGDHRVYVQPHQNYYVYRYPSYRYVTPRYYGYGYGYRYYDPYFAGDFYWTNHAWQPRSYYYGSNYGSNWDYDLGKLRLDIEQRDAEVYIDGYYAGLVDEFDGRLQGLRLQPGTYQVEIALPGFEPLSFDVRVTPGRTTTYRGSLLAEP